MYKIVLFEEILDQIVIDKLVEELLNMVKLEPTSVVLSPKCHYDRTKRTAFMTGEFGLKLFYQQFEDFA